LDQAESKLEHEPLVSVVIASTAGGPPLFASLQSLIDAADTDVELIVAECAPLATRQELETRFPNVRLLHYADRRSLAELRAAGIRAACGAVVAIVADYCVARDDWLRALRRAHRGGAAAVGGAIENRATERIIDWAVFFCEYGRHMLPLPRRPTADLAGCNVSYTRAALHAFDDLLARATWEPLWHDRLASRRLKTIQDPSVVVFHTRRYSLAEFAVERYHYARSFAGQRVVERAWPVRCVLAAGSCALPAILLIRLARQLVPKRRHLRELLLSVPYLMALAVVTAIGEAVGYAAGPGRSAQRV
jgi:hypothetical protein